ncbi:MAG: helix-turn-helix domain-containing protein [Candidatus Omnitrophica bacterium]|nr:helix-turn-helix domain-containing protein [Candidatus Omnitrophota bacterium]
MVLRERTRIGKKEVALWQYALRVFREDMYWSREQLAQYIGVSTRSIVYWEEGQEPGLRAQAKLVMALQELPVQIERMSKRFFSRFFPATAMLTGEEIIKILESKGLDKKIKSVLAEEMPEIADLPFREALYVCSQKKPELEDGYMQNREAEQYVKLQKVYTALKGKKKNPGVSFARRKAPESKKPVAGKGRGGQRRKTKDPGGGDDEGGSDSDGDSSETGDEDVWLDIGQLARYLNIKESTLYSWAESKFIPSYKLGRLRRFNKGEIDSWIKQRGNHDGNSPTFIDNLTRDLRKTRPGYRVNHKEVDNGSF